MTFFAACVACISFVAEPVVKQAEPPVNACDSALITQTRDGLAMLLHANTAGGAGGTIACEQFKAVYKGKVSVEAHLQEPGQVREEAAELELWGELATRSLRVVEREPETKQWEVALVKAGRAALQAGEGKPYEEKTGESAKETIAYGERWTPWMAMDAARAAASTCRAGAPVKYKDATLKPLSYVDASGQACTLLFDDSGRLARIESLAADARLGDVCEWTEFGGYEPHSSIMTPAMITRFMRSGNTTVRYELKLVSFEAELPWGSFLLPKDHGGDIASWTDEKGPLDGFEFADLVPGLTVVEIAKSNSRVLVIERPEDLILIGAPDGDDLCSALIAALSTRFAGKRVAAVSFSHYHPSYTGGLRALSASGAAIVTQAQLQPFVRGVLERPTTLGSPATAPSRTAEITLFDKEAAIKADANTVRLIDIGEKSHHTKNYIVYYFPEHGILFQDDLVYQPAEGAIRVTPRLLGLVEAMKELNITPKRLVCGWPLKNSAREIAWDDVIAAVGKQGVK